MAIDKLFKLISNLKVVIPVVSVINISIRIFGMYPLSWPCPLYIMHLHDILRCSSGKEVLHSVLLFPLDRAPETCLLSVCLCVSVSVSVCVPAPWLLIQIRGI